MAAGPLGQAELSIFGGWTWVPLPLTELLHSFSSLLDVQVARQASLRTAWLTSGQVTFFVFVVFLCFWVGIALHMNCFVIWHILDTPGVRYTLAVAITHSSCSHRHFDCRHGVWRHSTTTASGSARRSSHRIGQCRNACHCRCVLQHWSIVGGSLH